MRNKSIAALAYITAVLLVATLAANIYSLVCCINAGLDSTYIWVSSAVKVLTCGFGAAYIFSGYRKSGRVIFKLFLDLILLGQLVAFFDSVEIPSFNLCLIAVGFGAISLLAFANDLGEVKSKVAAGIFLATAVYLLISVFTDGWIADTMLVKTLAVQIITTLVSALAVYALICAKYSDKEARGTK